MEAKEIWFDNLIIQTPREAIQTDTQARKKLSSDYANDTGQLSASANVIAIKVQIIDQANNYWKNEK